MYAFLYTAFLSDVKKKKNIMLAVDPAKGMGLWVKENHYLTRAVVSNEVKTGSDAECSRQRIMGILFLTFSSKKNDEPKID